jgi:hypothetical protein
MAKNRDVKTDVLGKPIARLRASGEDSRCSSCHLVLDLSGIGMPTNTPLNMCSREDDTYIRWHLGSIPLAQTPKGLSPAEAAAVLDRDCLLAAHRRFIKRPRGT